MPALVLFQIFRQELLDKKPVNLLVMEVACNDKKEDSESTRCRASVKVGRTGTGLLYNVIYCKHG